MLCSSLPPLGLIPSANVRVLRTIVNGGTASGAG
jgi:hypothetical protein